MRVRCGAICLIALIAVLPNQERSARRTTRARSPVHAIANRSKTAGRTIKRYEAMHMVRKGQIERIGKGVVEEQVRFAESLVKVTA